MRTVVQRVSRASVTVENEIVGEIERGLLVLLAVAAGDTDSDARALAAKLAGLRIFSDDGGKMNLSVVEVGGSVLLVSQFTLLADARRGRRPSFADAADPRDARGLLDCFAGELRSAGLFVAEGRFGSHMDVDLVNDGPVTIILEAAGGRVVG